jgi:hypothetical protein
MGLIVFLIGEKGAETHTEQELGTTAETRFLKQDEKPQPVTINGCFKTLRSLLLFPRCLQRQQRLLHSREFYGNNHVMLPPHIAELTRLRFDHE